MLRFVSLDHLMVLNPFVCVLPSILSVVPLGYTGPKPAVLFCFNHTWDQ